MGGTGTELAEVQSQDSWAVSRSSCESGGVARCTDSCKGGGASRLAADSAGGGQRWTVIASLAARSVTNGHSKKRQRTGVEWIGQDEDRKL